MAEEEQLDWVNFIKKTVGNNDQLCEFIQILYTIPAMMHPNELKVNFELIRGQFSNSEDKFINMLIESNFTNEQDYCKIDVENEKFSETKLYLSYNCLKLFIMDRNDSNMLRSIIWGEQIFNQYKNYNKIATKKESTKTHFMIIEQKQVYKEGAVLNNWNALSNPKTFIRILAGSKKVMDAYLVLIKNQIESKSKSNNEDDAKPKKVWGKIIVPCIKAIFVDASDDINHIKKHVSQVLLDEYKNKIKSDIKAKKAKDKKCKLTAPKKTEEWGVVISTSIMMVNDKKNVSFTHNDIVKCIKEYFINLLAREHTNISTLSHDEYLQKFNELEQARNKNFGYFSALKSNAIEFKNISIIKKLQEKEHKLKAKNDKNQEKEATVNPAPSENGYETDGSNVEETLDETLEEEEVDSEVEEEEEEVESEVEEVKPKAKPAKAKPSKDNTNEEETKPKAKPTRAKPAKQITKEIIPDSDSDST